METLETGQFALVRVRENGKAQQMGMTAEQSRLFQLLVASLSSDDSPLIAMPKQHDLVLCQQVNKWISVDDDMPDIDTEVLTYRHSFKNGDLYIHCVHTEAGFIDYRSGLLIKEPTHWQPLPEPPKGKGEDDE